MRAIDSRQLRKLVSRTMRLRPYFLIVSAWAAGVPGGVIGQVLVAARNLCCSLALVLLAGCAGQGVTKTGFLSSYDGMRPTEDHTDDLIYLDPALTPSTYTSVIIEPVVWSPAPDSPPRDPEVIEELKSDFQKSLTEALTKSYKIVDPAAGPVPSSGVLRIRSAITNTRRANWYLNAPTMLTAVIVGPPIMPDPGGASEEMEAIDANTGKRVLAIATFKNGMPWNPLGGVQEFGHARRAFGSAAELLEEQLAGSDHTVKTGP